MPGHPPWRGRGERNADRLPSLPRRSLALLFCLGCRQARDVRADRQRNAFPSSLWRCDRNYAMVMAMVLICADNPPPRRVFHFPGWFTAVCLTTPPRPKAGASVSTPPSTAPFRPRTRTSAARLLPPAAKAPCGHDLAVEPDTVLIPRQCFRASRLGDKPVQSRVPGPDRQDSKRSARLHRTARTVLRRQKGRVDFLPCPRV